MAEIETSAGDFYEDYQVTTPEKTIEKDKAPPLDALNESPTKEQNKENRPK